LIFVAFSGCGRGSGDDAIIKQNIELNNAAADDLAKMKELDELNSFLTNYVKKRKQILGKIGTMPQDKIKAFVKRLDTEVKDSQDKLDQAMADFHKRLLEGKTNPQVLMETSMGPVKIELFEYLAPITVKNFLDYVDEKYYDGMTFHRVISDFMIQGGGFEPGMKKEKKSRPPIKNESNNGLSNNRGTLAMARTDDPNSATSQFFINVKDNGFLNKLQAPDGVGYAVFGRVIDGMDVVDKIKEVDTNPQNDMPFKDVLITSIRRVDKKK
jgi:cyclophilin family peptidyl-prolyl cis-trans isomerase